MPSSPLDELLQGADPMDVATIFAGMRNTVPLSMLFRHGELGPGEMEELAKRWASNARPTVDKPLPDQLEMTPGQVDMQNMAFNMQYRDPRIFGIHPDKPSINNQMLRAMMDEYNRQASNPYSKETATRRRNFEEAPIRADQFMSAAPKKTKKYANGGAIDFSTPDMADGGRFIPDAQPFNKGGSAKKTLDQMMAEMAQKGVKLADKPDLARRGFLGLGKAADLPLAKLDKDMFKNAPAITEKSVTIDPGKGAAKSTLKSISETPMSRREVLQSAAGQVMRGAMPDLGGLGNVAKVAESMAPAAVSADMAPGLIMAAIKRGMSEEEAVKFVRSQLGDVPPTKAFNLNDPKHVQLEAMYKHLSDPEWAPNEWEFFGPMRPSGALNVMLHTPSADVSPLQLRGALRQIREADPKRYQQLINASKDFSMSTGETAVEMGMISPQDLAKYMKGEHAQPNIRPENLWSE